MAPLPPLPGAVRIVVKQSLAGVSVYNVLHAIAGVQPHDWTSGELSTLSSAVRAAWVTNVIPLQSANLTLTDVTVTDIGSDTGGESTATGTTAGGVAGTSSPANVAVTWSWKISTRYRGGHPRTYIGGIPQSAISTANTMTSTTKTNHATAAAAIRTAVNAQTAGGNPVVFGVVHYRRGGVLLDIPIFSPITGVSVDDRFDSQRRRLGRDRT